MDCSACGGSNCEEGKACPRCGDARRVKPVFQKPQVFHVTEIQAKPVQEETKKVEAPKPKKK